MRALKCSVLYFDALMLMAIGTEGTKSLVAAQVGIPNTLFHVATAFDREPIDLREAAIVWLSPLAFALVVSVAAVGLVRRARPGALRVFLLYLIALCASSTLGTAMSASWGGTLHSLAIAMDVPTAVMITISITGTLLFAVVLWEIGVRLPPPLGAVVIPVAAGTAARWALLSPLPLEMYGAMALGVAYWSVVAAASSWSARRQLGGSSREAADFRLPLFVWSLALLLAVISVALRSGVRFE